MREELVRSWDKYDSNQLLVELIKNFEVRNVDFERSPLIRIASDASDFQLDEAFEAAMYNLENYCTLAPFSKHYPELEQLVSGFQSASNFEALTGMQGSDPNSGKANIPASLNRTDTFDRVKMDSHLASPQHQATIAMYSQLPYSKTSIQNDSTLDDLNKTCEKDDRNEQDRNSHAHHDLLWEFSEPVGVPIVNGETFDAMLASAQDDGMSLYLLSSDPMGTEHFFYEETR